MCSPASKRANRSRSRTVPPKTLRDLRSAFWPYFWLRCCTHGRELASADKSYAKKDVAREVPSRRTTGSQQQETLTRRNSGGPFHGNSDSLRAGMGGLANERFARIGAG